MCSVKAFPDTLACRFTLYYLKLQNLAINNSKLMAFVQINIQLCIIHCELIHVRIENVLSSHSPVIDFQACVGIKLK